MSKFCYKIIIKCDLLTHFSALPPQCISSTELVFRDGHTSRRTSLHQRRRAKPSLSSSPLLLILLFLTDAFLGNFHAWSVMCSGASFLFISLSLCSSWKTCLQAGVLSWTTGGCDILVFIWPRWEHQMFGVRTV